MNDSRAVNLNSIYGLVMLICVLFVAGAIEYHVPQGEIKWEAPKYIVDEEERVPEPVSDFHIIETQFVATGYAPLDPKAVKGMCYSGDPNVTASGRRTDPDVTIAAPKNIPFGTYIYIVGIGLRRVDDRGGSIKGNRIDICFRTRKEALEWGRRTVDATVFLEK